MKPQISLSLNPHVIEQQSHMSLQTLTMGSLWTIFLLQPFLLSLLLHVIASTGENASETQQKDTDRVTKFLTQSLYERQESNLAQGKPMFGSENGNFLGQPLSWTIMSSEDTDRQGVLGEYSEESTETPLSYLEGGGLLSKRTKSVTEDSSSMQTAWSSSGHVPKNPTHEQRLHFLSAESSTVSVLVPAPSKENEETSTTLQKTIGSHLPFLLSGSLSPHKLDQKSSSLESDGPGLNPEHYSPSAGTNNWGWTKVKSVSKEEKQNRPDDVTDHSSQNSKETSTGKSHI